MERTTTGRLSSYRADTLRPPGRALVAILLVVSGSAWLISARLATPDMRTGVLTGAAMTPASNPMGMSGAQMGMPGSMPMGLGPFIAAWTVMMVAMMVPSLIPAIRSFDAWARTMRRRSGAAALLLAGYLLLWSATGGIAYLVVQALHAWLPAGTVSTLRIGGALLVVAGVYQLTPPKRACLRQCRSPRMDAAPPVGAPVPGHLDAVRAGLGHGVCCLGSSWPLMLVLLLVGMMNLAWMGIIAGVIFVEKVVPSGDRVSRAVGWGLAGCGLILLAAPHPLPVLGGG